MVETHHLQKATSGSKALIHRILVVSNEAPERQSMRLLLEESHYDVDTASNAFEALEQLDQQDYHLIFCNTQMPGVSGPEMVKSMRETCKQLDNRQIPVIFIADITDPDFEREIKLLSFIYRPFDPFQILQLLRIHLGSQIDLKAS